MSVMCEDHSCRGGDDDSIIAILSGLGSGFGLGFGVGRGGGRGVGGILEAVQLALAGAHEVLVGYLCLLPEALGQAEAFGGGEPVCLWFCKCV